MIKTPQTNQATAPATNSGADDLFLGAMALNRKRFEDGCFDDAYHALEAALHLSEIAGSEDGPLLVERIANEQFSWINQHAPNYHHSCASTAQRGNRAGSIWEGLALMAHMRARALAPKPSSPLSPCPRR